MRHERSRWKVIWALGMAGCAATSDLATSETVSEGDRARAAEEASIEQLEADFDGPDGLMEFFTRSSEEDIRALLALHGMSYVVHQVAEDTKYIGDCPKYFPSSDRNTWHNFDGEYYYVDGAGRPKQAYKYLPPVASAPRNSSCQTSIGQWGDAENPSNDYDGGHLIGSQLGGWGKRANIVPQDANFNRGNWAQLENAAAKCDALSSERLLYQVTVGYPNSTALIPSSFGLYLQDRVQGDSISLSFSNVDYGGSSGTSERQQGVSFLQANGCQ